MSSPAALLERALPFDLASGAWAYAWPPLLFALLTLAVYPPASLLGLALAGAVLAFYRDPERTPPESGVVAPADGTVSVLRSEPPEGHSRTDGEATERVRVGVFMNVTDVHVNRAPMAGTVESVTHRPGANKPAFSKDSDRNERVDVVLSDVADTQGTVEVSLIAGWFARRIHPYVEAGDDLARGQRLGHISFGSRADVLLPPEYGLTDVTVEEGETVRAGETVLAPPPGDLTD